MIRRILILIAPLVVAATLWTASLAAQDSNQTAQNQTNIQPMDDQEAAAAARAFYKYALQLRRMGYTGPLPLGLTPESLKDVPWRQCCSISRDWHAPMFAWYNITRDCASLYWNGHRWMCQ